LPSRGGCTVRCRLTPSPLHQQWLNRRDSGVSATHMTPGGTARSGNRNRPGALNKAWD
jgi:hypothetical protein